MQHIIYARRRADVPAAWGRLEWTGQKWVDTEVAREAGSREMHVPTSLRGLVQSIIADCERGSVTLTPRIMLDIVQRGDPSNLGVPLHATAEILCPLRSEALPTPTSLWTRVLIAPSTGLVKVLHPQANFVRKSLSAEIRSVLTDSDIAERCRLHDHRELWVRPAISAEELAPDSVPPLTAPDSVVFQENAPARKSVIETRIATERGKAFTKKSADAAKANEQSGKEFAAKEGRKRASATK